MERSMDYYRGRRLRQNCVIRDFCRETKPLGREELIMPYFVVETDDRNYRKEIPSMPGQYQLSLAQLEKMVAKDIENGLMTTLLFGLPARKDEQATSAWEENGIVQQAVRMLKKLWPDLLEIGRAHV